MTALQAVFPETSDPEAYVARAVTEELIGQLDAALQSRSRSVSLVGPPGLGKTLCLRVLAERARLRGDQLVYLPYAALDLPNLCAWALGLMRRSIEGDPCEALFAVARAAAEAGRVLGLLLDDASSMPLATARALGDRLRAGGAALALVLAAPDDARTSRVAAALGLDLVALRLDALLAESDTRHHLNELLRRANAEPVLWQRFGPETVARLHGLSGGNPRRLHALAREIARGATPEHAAALLELDLR